VPVSPSTFPGRPVRVLYITPVGERGGAEVVLLNILKHHDRARYTPMVCLLKEGPLVEEIRCLGIKSVLVPTGRFRSVVDTFRAIREIRRFLREEAVDLVFSNLAMGHLYGGLAALGTSVKRVWFQHTIPSITIVECLAALIPANRLYVNSQATLRAVHRLRPRAKSVQTIYPGIEAPSPSLNTTERVLLKREFGISDEALVVAMVGRFQKGKGQHLFVEAAAEVCRQLPDTRFLIIGDTALGRESEYKAELAMLVSRHQLSPSVIFMGWRNDVPAVLNEVDVLVHPATAPESFGLVVVEALLQGKPVVVSRQGGLAEIVTDGETGFLVPPGDTEALVDRILLLLRDESLRRRMGARGREVVLEDFAMARMIAELERSYDEVLGLRPSLIE